MRALMPALPSSSPSRACHHREFAPVSRISIYLHSYSYFFSGPASKIVVKFFLAMGCGLLGSLFTFPGLRMAKMHWDSLKYCRGNRLLQVLLNLSFVLPFILVILWIRPISRDYLTVRVFQGMQQPL